MTTTLAKFMWALSVIAACSGRLAERLVTTDDAAYFELRRYTEDGQTKFAAGAPNNNGVIKEAEVTCGGNRCNGEALLTPPEMERVTTGRERNVPWSSAVVSADGTAAELDHTVFGLTPLSLAYGMTEFRADGAVRFQQRPVIGASLERFERVGGVATGLRVSASMFRTSLCRGCGDERGCTQCPSGTARVYFMVSAVLREVGSLTLVGAGGRAQTVQAEAESYGDNSHSLALPIENVLRWSFWGWNAVHFRMTTGRADLTQYSSVFVQFRCNQPVVFELNMGKTEDGDGGMWNLAKQACGGNDEVETINVPLPTNLPWMKSVRTVAWILVAPYNNGGNVPRTRVDIYPNFVFRK